MLKRSLVSFVVGLNLVLSPAMAVTPTAAPAKKSIDQKIPGSQPGAAFVNVKRIFALYGDLIKKQSYYEKVTEAVADGCPDPSKDIDEVAFGLDLTKVTESNGVGGVITGRFDLGRALGFLAKKGVTNLTPSVHRGVALMTGKDDDESLQFGLAEENTLVVSSDKTGEHAATKEIIATLNGETPGYAESTGSSLPADYLALVSTRIPQQIVDAFSPQVPPQFEVVTHVRALSLSVTAKDSGDGSASLTATCDTEESATGLTELLEAMRQNFAGSGISGTDLLNKLTISVEGKTAKLQLSIEKKELEEIFGN